MKRIMNIENHVENTVIGSEKYHQQKLKSVNESIMRNKIFTVSE